MSLNVLDPTTALIVIDLQTGLRHYPTASPVGEIAERAGKLAAAFRSHTPPVVAIDADTDPSAHANSVGYIFPGLGGTGTTAEIIALLDATRP